MRKTKDKTASAFSGKCVRHLFLVVQRPPSCGACCTWNWHKPQWDNSRSIIVPLSSSGFPWAAEAVLRTKDICIRLSLHQWMLVVLNTAPEEMATSNFHWKARIRYGISCRGCKQRSEFDRSRTQAHGAQ